MALFLAPCVLATLGPAKTKVFVSDEVIGT